MKRENNLFLQVVDPDNLRFAFWKAAKGKRYTDEVIAYQRHLDENLLSLRTQILSGTVEVGKYRYFKVFEPKERQICASAFSEQVLHHALIHVCHPVFERAQVFDSYASRKGKGTYAALHRAQYFSQRYDWYLKLDVRKFFETIHHDTLKAQLKRLFREKELLTLYDQIIDSYFVLPGRGVPIGNLTSQYFANHYLSPLDHVVKETLRCKAYVRYMDDMIVWGTDKQDLHAVLLAMDVYVRTGLKQELKPPQLNRITNGLPFLGYRVFSHTTRLLHKSKWRYVRKLRLIDEAYEQGRWTEAACQRRALALTAFTGHAHALAFRKKIILRSKGASS